MKTLALILLAALFLNPTSDARAASKSAMAVRNLDWAAVTLDKIEQDLAEVIRDHKITDTSALTSGFASARMRLAALKTSVSSPTSEPEDTGKAVDFTRNISNLAQSVLDHVNDQEQKRSTFRKLIDENPALDKTDLGRRFAEGIQSLAGDLVRVAALLLEDKQVEGARADGAWNLDGLRCDQLTDEGSDEAAYLKQREELGDNMREASKTISLNPLDAAREKVRAARRGQQDLAVEKLKLANQINLANVQTQMLDQNSGKLGDSLDLARQAYDEAHDAIQQAIDEN